MTTVHSLVSKIRDTKGTKAKKQLLAEHSQNALVRKFFYTAMEPLLNLYITKVPEQALLVPVDDTLPLDETAFYTDLLILVNHLNTRKVTKRADVAAAVGDLFIRYPQTAAREMFEMVVQRKTRTGLGEKSINEVFGAGFITMVPYQRCVLPKDSNMAKWAKAPGGNWITAKLSQIKADGEFANISIQDGRITVQTRNGRTFPLTLEDGTPHPAWEPLRREILVRCQEIDNPIQLHGELLIQKADGTMMPRAEGNGVFNSLLNDGVEIPEGCLIVYHVWDEIPLSAAVSGGTYALPYINRFGGVNGRFANGRFITPIETRTVWNMEQAREHLNEALARGEEGTVLKDSTAGWLDGDNPNNVKQKIEFEVDLILLRFVAGDANGKNADTFGSLELGTSDNLLVVSATGISDKDRARLHAHRNDYIGGVFKVKANDITYATKEGAPHSLFLPRVNIMSHRVDKSEADTFAQVEAQLAAARSAA